jgi:hypothetical protein
MKDEIQPQLRFDNQVTGPKENHNNTSFFSLCCTFKQVNIEMGNKTYKYHKDM